MKQLISFLIYIIIPAILYGTISEEKEINLIIEKVSNLDNLPNNEIRRLYQDSDGFIWIATTGGLYQFDGYNLTEYRSNIYNPELLTSNNITCLFEDNEKNLYIGTNNGLNVLNKITGKVSKINFSEDIKTYISDIIQVEDNEMWLGTNKGLFSYNEKDKTLNKILNRNIKDLFIDSQFNIWAGTWKNGLYRYNKEKHEWIKYPKFNGNNSVHIIFEDSRKRIWTGSFGSGITLLNNPYDMNELSWTNFTAEDKENRISDDYIYAITENPLSNSLIFGTRKGLSILPLINDNKFTWINLYPSVDDKSQLSFNEVDAIINDNQNNIWIGTLGGGVYCIKSKYNDFQKNLIPEVQQKLHSNTIKSILIDSEKQIWTGIGANGFSISKDNESKIFSALRKDRKHETFARVHCILESPYNKKYFLEQTVDYISTMTNMNMRKTTLTYATVFQIKIIQYSK